MFSDLLMISKFQFTPLREGRLPKMVGSRKRYYFNSRPCERGDLLVRFNQHFYLYFNSRPCERGDNRCRHMRFGRSYFNSRPCERGDLTHRVYLTNAVTISIHAPARGATIAAERQQLFVRISIHAPARGATAKLNKICSVFSAIIEKNS